MMRRSLNLCALLVGVLALAGCPPKYPKCDSDKDCHTGEYCVNGTCQQCRSDSDCKSGQVCKAGRCEAPPAQSCTDDSQCPAGQSCIDGTCKPCQSDDQCGPGGKCNAGRCQRAPVSSGPSNEGACSLQAIYFDFNESSLTTEATSGIDADVECMKKNGSGTVTLTGHTDPRGTEEYNLSLSDKRAQSVKERMVREGVQGSKLKTVARGKMDATGNDESGWAKDRRVDVQ